MERIRKKEEKKTHNEGRKSFKKWSGKSSRKKKSDNWTR